MLRLYGRFTGSALPTSSAFAASAIDRNADKYFRGSTYEAFVNDDWRVSATLTVNAGIRWEYESPITEAQNRLVNLDVASGFTAVSPVLSTDPVGSLTGQRYERSLLYPDKRGFLPRLGVAWRPIPGSSLVIRGGYGLYRTPPLSSIMLILRPPLSNPSVQNHLAAPLTLANGYNSSPLALNTFAVIQFRVAMRTTAVSPEICRHR